MAKKKLILKKKPKKTLKLKRKKTKTKRPSKGGYSVYA